MSVFLAALVLLVLFAATGHRLGAIRGVISLVGIVAGTALAFPLTPKVTPLFTAAGSTNPLWNWVLPPLSVFVGMQIVFAVIAFIVHRKVEWHYKYKATDETRHCWDRLNSRLGMCVAVFAACAYLLLLGTLFYAAGYLTYQLSAGDPSKDDPRLKNLNAIRDDLHTTGLDRAIVAIDPTPPGFYAAADLVGLLYHNPPLQARLGDYPALLELAERSEFQDLARDPQFNDLLLTHPGVMEIVNHPKVQAVFSSADVLQAIYKLSPQDLLKFVQTGQSDLYASEKILGRWVLDSAATVGAAYRNNPKITSTESRNLKRQLDVIEGLALIATPDKKLFLRSATLNNQGTWSSSGGRYAARIAGPSISVGRGGAGFDEAEVSEGSLQLRSTGDGFTLVFTKPG